MGGIWELFLKNTVITYIFFLCREIGWLPVQTIYHLWVKIVNMNKFRNLEGILCMFESLREKKNHKIIVKVSIVPIGT